MATYRAYNKRLLSWASAEIPDVLDTKALAGVSTTSGSNVITVTSTTGVFPGMGLSVPNIPRGAFVQSVKSATEIVAFAPLLNAATGEWTVTAAAANATANGSSMTGHAHGFNPVPIPEAITNGDVWRNTFTLAPADDIQTPVLMSSSPDVYQYLSVDPAAGNVIITPGTTVTAGTNGSSPAKIIATNAMSYTLVNSDEFTEKPYRAKTRWRHNHWLVSSTGNISTIPADVDIVVQLIASTSA